MFILEICPRNVHIVQLMEIWALWARVTNINIGMPVLLFLQAGGWYSQISNIEIWKLYALHYFKYVHEVQAIVFTYLSTHVAMVD